VPHHSRSSIQPGAAPLGHSRCGRDKEPRSSHRTGLSLRKLVKETCASAGCLRKRSTADPHRRSSAGALDRRGNTELGSRMDEIFSPVIFIYGLALILGVGKACTLLIWRTLPKPRPGLRQEVREAWQRQTRRMSPEKTPEHPPTDPAADIPGRSVPPRVAGLGLSHPSSRGWLPTSACRCRTPWDGSWPSRTSPRSRSSRQQCSATVRA
jgi:hypothetical protein